MTRRGKSGFSSKIVAWVHSGRESDSGKSWVIPGERASLYLGPLLGTADRNGKVVPIFNLEREGYWGSYSVLHDESNFHRSRTQREAINAAYEARGRLGEEERPEKAKRTKTPKKRNNAKGRKGQSSMPADEYWTKRRLLERMAQTPLAPAHKPDKGIKSGFTNTDFADRG